ncbi:class I SAM-dependent methyltransferase [Thiorhodococcus fuscus]|uniref:Class I SAM-dependent methyltransferase n=1 Tax=Thiorhodococcus fuscus TaxID=527200 RepID=A0ABW4Y825_9GAMM
MSANKKKLFDFVGNSEQTYQSFPELGQISGARDCAQRIRMFDPVDFAGKSVLDLGCNLGGMLFEAGRLGATRLTGVEFEPALIERAEALNDRHRAGIRFICADIEDIFATDVLDERYDTILLLAVLYTSPFRDRNKLLSEIAQRCDVLYIEGHNGQEFAWYFNLMEWNTDFTTFRMMGRSTDQARIDRPLMRLSR